MDHNTVIRLLNHSRASDRHRQRQHGWRLAILLAIIALPLCRIALGAQNTDFIFQYYQFGRLDETSYGWWIEGVDVSWKYTSGGDLYVIQGMQGSSQFNDRVCGDLQSHMNFKFQITVCATPGQAVLMYDTTKVTVLRQFTVEQSVALDIWTVRVGPMADSILIAAVRRQDDSLVATAEQRATYARSIRRALSQLGARYMLVTWTVPFESSDEEGMKVLSDSTLPTNEYGIPLHDPIETAGTWAHNPDFARYHTYSTRYDTATGDYGLTERRDYIFISAPAMTDLARTGSPPRIGSRNDGTYYGQSLTRGGLDQNPRAQIEKISRHLWVALFLTAPPPHTGDVPSGDGVLRRRIDLTANDRDK